MTLANSLLSLATRIGTEFKTVRSEIDTTLTDYYTSAEVDSAIAAVVASSPAALDTLNELAAALGNDENFASTITTLIGTKADAVDVYTKTALDTLLAGKAANATTLAGYNIGNAYTKTEVDALVSTAALVDKVLNLQAPRNPSTTAVIAPALASIGNTNGYVINLSFGNFDEAGPIAFDNKWQLNVQGPPAASTTAVTIKNGISVGTSSHGVRFTRVQIEGTSAINSSAGLGHHFEKVQFMGNVTIGGTGGFMMFVDTDFGGDITISPSFAGTVYFIRCNFSKSAGVYTFGQSSPYQVIMADQTGLVAGTAYNGFQSGLSTYKSGVQAFFMNGTAISNAGATNGQVLKFNGAAFVPSADISTDATKLPLAGGTLTGALVLSGAPTADLHAATKKYADDALALKANASAVYSIAQADSAVATAVSAAVSGIESNLGSGYETEDFVATFEAALVASGGGSSQG